MAKAPKKTAKKAPKTAKKAPKLTGAASVLSNFPSGTIISWYARGGVFPAGWAVCDGTNGTPDLRGRFIRGVSDMADVGRLGGNEVHGHPASGPGPQHERVGVDTGGQAECMGVNHTHAINPVNHLPPYVDVLFMMRL